MTSSGAATRIRTQDDSTLTASCQHCGQTLRQVDGFDRDVAVGTLFLHHPSSPDACHRPDVPAGWCAVSDGAA